ncbi:ThiF family adenylyltransferase [Belliella kenyensis]|uniref:ThiF family adenylyltransferase n=1 Tax=Belliella kenyensis TaxID=1472724 RepID=A0ABV8ELA0_9BACT|nr:ThiF family adenylyltransferase [Belliella kenyensis]MCH7403640.1 ThiF family adenylyltransferase [Belliella kenyensis]MDN3602207.1 ThiF family adenylyltransferase [Belliella kenyensis]
MFTHKELDLDRLEDVLILACNKNEDLSIADELIKKDFIEIIDELDNQVRELIKLQNPTKKFSKEELKIAVEEFFEKIERATYGVWAFYPWKQTMVRLLPEEDFIAVRTVRNKYKITKEEQDRLSTKKIGIIGLSVGQSVAISLAMERLFGELRIADFDTLELGNMNRLRTSVLNLGLPKVTLVKREIAEIDPFMKVTVFSEGITEENMGSFFSDGGKLDLLIEECDNLSIKIESRRLAKSLEVPVIMDTSDRGMVDIERFDIEPSRPIFHGMLTGFGREIDLVDKAKESYLDMLMTILDFPKISKRGKESLSEIGKTISNWPQLGTSVIMGGAMCAHYARKILLGETVVSGRNYIDLDHFFTSSNES